ncbi:MAG: hypothetical protein BWY70_01927 [Bacteroidetes bacterium ADurb.Bin408]|nr:MAG: hypothetical protein BWY70_01927 [Bacteroidetes bacterium ADurb.Bin408]
MLLCFKRHTFLQAFPIRIFCHKVGDLDQFAPGGVSLVDGDTAIEEAEIEMPLAMGTYILDKGQ